MTRKMTRWRTGEAKQQSSEAIRRSTEEPQEILRREEGNRRSLGASFDEVRELAAPFDYQLETDPRRDRLVDPPSKD